MPTDQIRLRCYVDETGQDARSSQFIVVTVVIASDPEALRSILQAAESKSGKRQRKWTVERLMPRTTDETNHAD